MSTSISAGTVGASVDDLTHGMSEAAATEVTRQQTGGRFLEQKRKAEEEEAWVAQNFVMPPVRWQLDDPVLNLKLTGPGLHVLRHAGDRIDLGSYANLEEYYAAHPEKVNEN